MTHNVEGLKAKLKATEDKLGEAGTRIEDLLAAKTRLEADLATLETESAKKLEDLVKFLTFMNVKTLHIYQLKVLISN